MAPRPPATSPPTRRAVAAAIAATLLISACGSSGSDGTAGSDAPPPAYPYPAAPSVPSGDARDDLSGAATRLAQASADGGLDRAALTVVTASGDGRYGWLLSDLLRFSRSGDDIARITEAFTTLTGVDPEGDPDFDDNPWKSVTNHLIAWDLPEPTDYRETKALIFLAIEPGWEPFFSDPDADIDWRLLSWGGVQIDDRPLGDDEACPRGCIPALDDPATTDAAGGNWFDDEAFVFGIVEGEEAIALPKNIMEVHEMVNLTLGGRRLGIPYCTLCGAAQAYFTDDQPDGDLVLRTSGLLSRSNKVMYELTTQSVFDTFTGEALSGPLQEQGVELDQTTIVVTTWGEWKAEHPDTRIIAEDGGIGQSYPTDPLGGRDDDGPIFPTGPVDERLRVQAPVVGVITGDGTALAFDVGQATAATEAGDPVELDGVTLEPTAGGFVAVDPDGDELATHEAFWFAWSQFHPDTLLWTPTN